MIGSLMVRVSVVVLFCGILNLLGGVLLFLFRL